MRGRRELWMTLTPVDDTGQKACFGNAQEEPDRQKPAGRFHGGKQGTNQAPEHLRPARVSTRKQLSQRHYSR